MKFDIQKYRAKKISKRDRYLAKREEWARESERNHSNRPPFTICKRLQNMQAEKNVEWNKIDKCAECGVELVYDSRHSEGAIHICLVCAVKFRKHFGRVDGPLDPMNLKDKDLSDREMFAKLALMVEKNTVDGIPKAGAKKTP